MNDDKTQITDSLNEILDSKSIENMKMAAAIVKEQPDLIDKSQIHWYNLKDIIDIDNSVRYVELYYSSIKSDKVYILDMTEASGHYLVKGWYGRRGKTLQYDVKYRGKNIHDCEWIFEKVLNEKLKKGYKVIDENAK